MTLHPLINGLQAADMYVGTAWAIGAERRFSSEMTNQGSYRFGGNNFDRGNGYRYSFEAAPVSARLVAFRLRGVALCSRLDGSD